MSQEDNGGHPCEDNEEIVFIEETKKEEKKTENKEELVCGIDDVPSWYMCILLGLQQFLMMFGGVVSIPFILFPFLCAQGDQSVLVLLISTISFVAGIATVLQTAIGVRLPIVQGGTYSFVIPTIAILSLSKWNCPPGKNIDVNSSLINVTKSYLNGSEDIEWKIRIREIQGAVMVASFFEILIPFTGVLGFILRYVGPLTIAPTIALIGISLFEVAVSYSSKHWYIAILTMALITIFSQNLKHVACSATIQKTINGKKLTSETKMPIFALFPVLLAICVSWIICLVLTETNILPEDPTKWGYDARTDKRIFLIREASWFRIPYPGQWGKPTVSVGAVFGITAGVLASMVESIGDYYACAKLCGAPPPPSHAMSRGLFIEGCAVFLAGAWGSGNGTTTYSGNIGAIGLTKVASRRIIYVCGIFLLLAGCLMKFSALVATLPEPVLGGVLIIVFGMIASVGLSNLQHVNLSSSRTMFIVGTSILFGLGFPYWMRKYGKIETGIDEIDQIFTVICSTNMFIGGLVGFVLDNTIPGAIEERGLLPWDSTNKDHSTDEGIYDIPLIQEFIDESCLRYVPILSNRFDMQKRGKTLEDQTS